MEQDKFKARIEQIYQDLDRYNYYELLNLTRDAGEEQIRTSFHRMALAMHPDRHFTTEDRDLRLKLNTIYKRISEGYRVLMDTESRKEYDEILTEGKLRLVRTDRKQTGPVHPETLITDPQAKRFFELGLKAERKGDLKTAKLNYKFAMDLLPGNTTISERFDQVNKWLGLGATRK